MMLPIVHRTTSASCAVWSNTMPLEKLSPSWRSLSPTQSAIRMLRLSYWMRAKRFEKPFPLTRWIVSPSIVA